MKRLHQVWKVSFELVLSGCIAVEMVRGAIEARVLTAVRFGDENT